MTLRPLIVVRTLAGAGLFVALGSVGDVFAQPLPEVTSTEAAIRLGPLTLNPNMTVKGVGVEDNVFNDPTQPKADATATVAPDLEAILRSGVVRLRVYSVSDTVFYKKYRPVGGQNRMIDSRADLMFERLRPFVFFGVRGTQDRPNNEVDIRPRRRIRRYGGGAGAQVASRLGVVVTYEHTDTVYNKGIAIGEIDVRRFLDRVTDSVGVDVRFAATPLTTVVLTLMTEDDRFPFEPPRDNRARAAGLRLEFLPDAVIHGKLDVGYQQIRTGGRAPSYDGLVAGGKVGFSLFGLTRFDLVVDRARDYSIHERQPYFVRTGGESTINQRLFGPLDIQVNGRYEQLDYRSLEAFHLRPDRSRIDSVGYSAGWNLKDRSRIAVNVERTRRRSTLPDASYARRRVFLNWTYGF